MELDFFPHFSRCGIPHAVTTRHGGVSDPPFDTLNLGDRTGDRPMNISKNRNVLSGLPVWQDRKIFFARQVHEHEVLDVTAGSPEDVQNKAADGLVTCSADSMVGVLVADCFPVLMADRTGRIVAAVHAGRKGLEQGVIRNAVSVFTESYSVPVRDILVGIGPGISTDAYPVDEKTAEQFIARTGTADLHACCGPGTVKLDLRETIRTLLTRSGIVNSNIEHIHQCTAGNPERYFSYRRSGGVTGRFAALIGPRVSAPDPDSTKCGFHYQSDSGGS